MKSIKLFLLNNGMWFSVAPKTVLISAIPQCLARQPRERGDPGAVRTEIG